MERFNGKFPPPKVVNPASFLMATLQRKGLGVTGLSREEKMRAVRNNETSHLVGEAIFFVQWEQNPKADDLIVFENTVNRLEGMSHD